jgi:2-polyprenyl-3-methyl-5-hydroxy-6-metoxy-1,4-benzoquinol methylase
MELFSCMEIANKLPLFDRIHWRDPVSGLPLEPIISARTPAGVPICGAFRVNGTSFGYPIIDCVARLTPELAHRYRDWLAQLSLEPPKTEEEKGAKFQAESTVESFGWQWHWSGDMRSEADLHSRVAEKWRIDPKEFHGHVILDAGAGAGDQSRYLLQQGAAVASLDLSSAIEVVASKLRMHPGWVGVQGDITALPFSDGEFDVVYCEGVIQHTRDSVLTVRELCRTLKVGGRILASHYVRLNPKSSTKRLLRKITQGYYEFLRNRLSRLDRDKLLLLTGNLAALNYLPLIGWILRKTGTTMYSDLMPRFKTTWTNTFDYYGSHAYQRFITPEEFWGYFEEMGNLQLLFKGIGLVVARKTG